MANLDNPLGTPAQPALADLLSGYLLRQAEAHAAGLGPSETAGEVLPYEAVPVQPVDPKLAWEEALVCCRLLGPKADTGCQVPPHWPELVAAQEPAVALPFCCGNYPQLVRNLHLLLHGANLGQARPTPRPPLPAPLLAPWAEQTAAKGAFPEALLGLGALRLAGHLDAADALVRRFQAAVPAAWRAAWDNDLAALAWQRGRAEEALGAWQSQADSVPVLFNRGMALLFLGQPAAARQALTAAVRHLPEAGAWHHLGQVYLAMT